MALLRRPYQSDADFSLLQEFVAEATRQQPIFDCHQGDLLWQRWMYEDHIGRWDARVAIWESDARPVAFAIYYDRGGDVVPFILPGWSGEQSLVADIVAWGWDRLAFFAGPDAPTELVISVMEGTPLQATIESLGLLPADWAPMRLSMRDDLSHIAETPLPDGFEVRPLRGPHEYDERIDAHREAFGRTRITNASYTRLRAQPGYDAELDLACVAPDGTIASYAIAWYDPRTRTGLFEPVGAREAFRGRGLTKAVLLEALRRLRARGVTAVFVGSDTDNPAAGGLYEAVEFCEVARWRYYRG